MAVVSIWENIYKMINEKRDEIYTKYGRRVQQQDIASLAILNGIDKVEGELGLHKE